MFLKGKCGSCDYYGEGECVYLHMPVDLQDSCDHYYERATPENSNFKSYSAPSKPPDNPIVERYKEKYESLSFLSLMMALMVPIALILSIISFVKMKSYKGEKGFIVVALVVNTVVTILAIAISLFVILVA